MIRKLMFSFTIAPLLIAIWAAVSLAQPAVIEYTLLIVEQEVNITGRKVSAMTINGAIPGPTLRFKEGDIARIHVHNRMTVETSIHWHGLLVPPDMDGVPLISFPPIEPGATFTYEFPIRQSGTYWYHSHTGLQEQRGLYGAIVIAPDPKTAPVARDHVALLSDWTDEDPHTVNRTLKRGSEWYAVRKRSAQSIFGAASIGMLGDYFRRELQRMPPMDISDVAYDRFLINGKPDSKMSAEPGETIRLRIVNGSATTYFFLEFSGGPMTLVSADGIDVIPVDRKRFLIAVAETYDVLVQVPESGSYELRATAHDGSGYASLWIGKGEHRSAPEVPKPNLYRGMGDISFDQVFALTPAGAMGMSDQMVDAGAFDRPGMMDMGGMHGMNHGRGGTEPAKHGSGHGEDVNAHGSMTTQAAHDSDMEMGGGNHADGATESGQDGIQIHSEKMAPTDHLLAEDIATTPNLAADGMDEERPWPPYEQLRSVNSTAFAGEERAVRDIRLTLDGDMTRYVWFLNNRPLAESDVILIRKGEAVRFIMINRTMMHHPMHLHGHFFRVLNKHGDYAPLKHTVNVAPMSTTVIEFDANEVGDWFFHCHLLYHMKNGMARVIHYENFEPGPEVAQIRSKLFESSWHAWGQADFLTHMTLGEVSLSDARNRLAVDWEVGWQRVEEPEWESLITWDRYFNRFFSIFAGANLGDAIPDERGLLGIRYLLPLNLESSAFIGTDGGARITVEKHFELTPRLSLLGEVKYDTETQWDGRVELDYMATRSLSFIGQWHAEYGFGLGVRLSY